MNKSENKKINIIEKIKENKKLQYILIIGISILLVFVFFFSDFNETEEINQSDSVIEYIATLENKLEKTLSKVDGVGKVSVIITIESGMETVLATKTTKTETINGTEIKEEPIIVNGKTVILKENYPKISGVMIVAEGADKISVMTKLQQATTSLLEIEVGQIEILKMKD